MRMKQITMKLIRSFDPCYDPAKHLPEDFKGTALDFLDQKQIPFTDKLWLLMRTDFVSERLMRIFAVWCARQVQHLMTDERSIYALDFMDAYIENYWLIDDEDWRQGWDAAGASAGASAWGAQEKKLRELIIAGIETGDTK